MAAVSMAPTTATPAHTGPTHLYTCNKCQVAFKSQESQRAHMGTGWHSYNDKRRRAGLPPLSPEVFNEKVLAKEAEAAATIAKATFQKFCTACQRLYKSENGYISHLNMKRHKDEVARLAAESTDNETASMTSSVLSLGDPVETSTAGDLTPTAEDPQAQTNINQLADGLRRATLDRHSADSDQAQPSGNTAQEREGAADGAGVVRELASRSCLFCNLRSDSVQENTTHMGSVHGMFVPEKEHLVDLEGLLEHLYVLVHEFHQCLKCGQLKRNAAGVQTHMRDKGHCMIAYESLEEQLEIGDFYNFESTYSDDSDNDEEEQKEDQEWEDLDDAEDTGSDASEQGHSSDQVTSAAARAFKSADKHSVYVNEDGRLQLSRTRTAGNRSDKHIYNQRLGPYADAEELRHARRLAIADGSVDDADSGADLSVIKPAQRGRPGAVTRADGGLGMHGVSEAKKKEAKKDEQRERNRARKQQERYEWKVQKRANNQTHYRPEELQ